MRTRGNQRPCHSFLLSGFQPGPHYFDGPHDDSLEGTAVSISRDDGKTWSEMQFLFEAGRHHANLQRLPNGDLVCTRWRSEGTNDGELMGMPPTGKHTTGSGITIDKIKDGKVVESWNEWDNAGLMQQLGVGEPAGAAAC